MFEPRLSHCIVLWLLTVTACSAQNENANSGQAQRLECPALKSGIYVEHCTDEFGVTYSLEWDTIKRANRWSAYFLNDDNSAENVDRSSGFMADPLLPDAYKTTDAEYKRTGFNRGHLCPSMDRRANETANLQTFYLSNIQPQYKKHNLSIWKRVENLVHNIWNSSNFRDTLYVVKAATIDDDKILSYTWSSLIVPKYFYVALLCLKDGAYKAMGIITEHVNKTTRAPIWSDYCVSIDSLETFTGIDFFCNLPDSIEDEIEAETNFEAWGVYEGSNDVTTNAKLNKLRALFDE